jgi:tellurium resistance protein TerD
LNSLPAVSEGSGSVLTRDDLNEDASVETAMIFGEVYRHNSDWKFRAVGQGCKGGLGPLAKNYGENVR